MAKRGIVVDVRGSMDHLYLRRRHVALRKMYLGEFPRDGRLALILEAAGMKHVGFGETYRIRLIVEREGR
jgi:hypothetical protein